VLVVFGTVCLDRIRRIPQLPKPGGYVEVDREVVLLGGEAANTANALAAWGEEVWLCGNDVGLGPDGELLRQKLAARGLQVHLVGDRSKNAVTPVCDVYVNPDGERTMFGLGFRDMEPVLIPSLLPLRPGAWFTAEPNMAAVSRQAVREAIAAGMKTYTMDFVGPNDPIAPGSFWQTSTDWYGGRNETFANIERVRELVALHRCFAILSDGANGFVAGSLETGVRAYPPFPAPEVIDSTGAGDIFRAGMLLGLTRSWPVPRCLEFAAAAGSLSCRALGATTSVPTIAEIKAFICEYPTIAAAYR
jgi:sugar/nucleoside kinase (ribokinase family)